MNEPCVNCGVADCSYGVCEACAYLAREWSEVRMTARELVERFDPAQRVRLDRLTNRRWQMRFNRGELR